MSSMMNPLIQPAVLYLDRRDNLAVSEFAESYIATRKLERNRDVKALVERTVLDYAAKDPVSRTELSWVLDARWGFKAG
jgi:hypothetical protein